MNIQATKHEIDSYNKQVAVRGGHFFDKKAFKQNPEAGYIS